MKTNSCNLLSWKADENFKFANYGIFQLYRELLFCKAIPQVRGAHSNILWRAEVLNADIMWTTLLAEEGSKLVK